MKARTISDEDLRSAITIQKKTRTGEYICDCPFCHKSLHLYINIKTQVFQCKKCWTEGSVYKLLKQLDKTYLMGDKSIEYKDNIKSIQEILEQQREKVELRELPEKKMPVGFKICKNNRYLKSRGISNDDCEYYRIGKTDLVTKYDGEYPIWVFVEIVPFGRLIKFYRFIAEKLKDKKMINESYMLMDVRELRNACAHNNCIIHD